MIVCANPALLPRTGNMPWIDEHYIMITGAANDTYHVIDDYPRNGYPVPGDNLVQAYRGIVMHSAKGALPAEEDYRALVINHLTALFAALPRQAAITSLADMINLDNIIYLRDGIACLRTSRKQLSLWMRYMESCYAIDAGSAYEAQRNIMRSPIAFGLNLFIADRNGFAVDYELTARGTDFFYPENGLLLHTNHFISSKPITRNVHKQMYPNSLNRYAVTRRWLEKDGITLDDLIGLISCHNPQNADDNICRHGSDPAFFLEIIFTMIVELKNLHMYLCFDPPCSGALYKINLANIFT